MCEENLILLTDAYWTFPGKASAAVYILQHMCRFATGNLWDTSTWGTAGLLSGTRNSQEWKWQGDVCSVWMLLSITLPGWTIWKQFWELIHRNGCSVCHADQLAWGSVSPSQALSLTPSGGTAKTSTCLFSATHFRIIPCVLQNFPSQCAEDQYSSSFGHYDAISEW